MPPPDHGSTVTPLKSGPMAELEALRAAAGEGGDLPPPPEMKVTHEEMKAAKIPLLFRDYCAHILIPLNECRTKSWFMPWACTDLRHSYEKCQYDEYERRVTIAKLEKAGGGE